MSAVRGVEFVPMRRCDFWKVAYRARRYLEHLTKEELGQRFNDIFANLLTLTLEGKLAPRPIGKGGEWLSERFAHVLEEYALRGRRIPTGVLTKDSLPKTTFPAPPRAAELERRLAKLRGPYLLKFAQKHHLSSMLAAGQWRIAPASSYQDRSLNPAQQDEELQRIAFGIPSEVELEFFDHRTGKSMGKGRPSGNLQIKTEILTNYYVSCVAQANDLRLLDDWGASACLIIREPLEFVRRVFVASKKELPGWHGFFKTVGYYDPFFIRTKEMDPFTSKHFRYFYQSEARLLWVPGNAERDLEPVFLDIGSIDDISELFFA